MVLHRAPTVRRLLGRWLVPVAVLSTTPVIRGQIDDPRPPTVVSADRPGAPHVEPHLSAHPTDPEVLLAGSITFYGLDSLGDATTDLFVSSDGGKSWKRHRLADCGVDPWTGFGPEGEMYATCMSASGGTTAFYRSTDGGDTFDGPVAVPRAGFGPVDHPVFVVDHSDGAGRGQIWVGNGQSFPAPGLDRSIYGLTVSRSDDGGRSFTDPMPSAHDNVQQQPIDAVALGDGTPLFLVGDYAIDTPRGQEMIDHRRTWLVAGGEQRATPLLVKEQSGRELPWRVAAGVAPGGGERIYVVFDSLWSRQPVRHDEIGEDQRSVIELSSSDDRGWTWSQPVTVSGGPARANRETPTVAVAADGTVGVAWYDTRADEQGECFDIYFAASTDGGENFGAERRISTQTSCPLAHEQQRGVASRWRFGGDYSGLAAAADGRFHLLWAGVADGWYQLFTIATPATP